MSHNTPNIHSDYSLFYFFLLWFTLLSTSLGFIVVNGIDYVSWPRLIPPTDIIYYNGPGYRSAHNGKGFGNKEIRDGVGRSARWLNSGRKRAGSRIGIEEGDIPMGNLGTKKRVD